MLRNLALASLGLLLLAGPAAARGDGPARGGRAETKVSFGGAKVEQHQRSPLLLRRVVATGVRPVAVPAAAVPAACGRASSRAGAPPRCRGHAVNWGGGWAHGLPPALGVQARECPSGTMATLAEGHDDVVRCIPL